MSFSCANLGLPLEFIVYYYHFIFNQFGLGQFLEVIEVRRGVSKYPVEYLPYSTWCSELIFSDFTEIFKLTFRQCLVLCWNRFKMIYYEKDLHIIEVKDGGLQFSGHFQLDLVNQFESKVFPLRFVSFIMNFGQIDLKIIKVKDGGLEFSGHF